MSTFPSCLKNRRDIISLQYVSRTFWQETISSTELSAGGTKRNVENTLKLYPGAVIQFRPCLVNIKKFINKYINVSNIWTGDNIWKKCKSGDSRWLAHISNLISHSDKSSKLGKHHGPQSSVINFRRQHHLRLQIHHYHRIRLFVSSSLWWCTSGTKKVAVLLDFVQMREGGWGMRALPKFFVHFSQTVYIGSIWGWGRRGDP